MMRSPRLFLRFVLRSLLFHPLIDESPHPHQSYCLANVQESEDLEKNGEDDTPNGGDIGEEGEKLEVDELLDVGEDKKTGEPIWFCKWKGYDGSRNTWEPRHCLDGKSREGHLLLLLGKCWVFVSPLFLFSHTKYGKLIPCINSFVRTSKKRVRLKNYWMSGKRWAF